MVVRRDDNDDDGDGDGGCGGGGGVVPAGKGGDEGGNLLCVRVCG